MFTYFLLTVPIVSVIIDHFLFSSFIELPCLLVMGVRVCSDKM